MTQDGSSSTEDLHFGVDLERIAALGLIGAGTLKAREAYDRLGLSSADRLYHELASDLTLGMAAFSAGDRVAQAGEDVINAHIIRSGVLEVEADGRVMRIGPGSVIGLAEGLALHKHRMTVTAITDVSAAVIPIYRALRTLYQMHKGLKGITRNTVMRILQIGETPETFK
jgi:CRP-like cAMP-binding protein